MTFSGVFLTVFIGFSALQVKILILNFYNLRLYFLSAFQLRNHASACPVCHIRVKRLPLIVRWLKEYPAFKTGKFKRNIISLQINFFFDKQGIRSCVNASSASKPHIDGRQKMETDITGNFKKTILNHSISPTDIVLDIGCGNGEKTHYISQHAKRVIGIDPSQEQINAAKNNFPADNLVFHTDPGESLNFPASSFTLVLFCESLHHIPFESHKKAIKEAFRVLKPGGRLLVIEPVYGKGIYEKISKFYNDEKTERAAALKTIHSVIAKKFHLVSEQEIYVKYMIEDFDDLYKTSIASKPYSTWKNENRQPVLDILNSCERTPEGGYIIDDFERVWLFVKNGNQAKAGQ